ncbi:RHS Repeat family [Microscilla marina]|uniref:RHS Repeat family n=1 Tax=Microscilla marina ATCC 23134 TaxID=313606 RepID=A1ZWB8_MICM2|nr:RHS Repeat family [Microscilla marina]EAY25356.1 RHS Repeat family [Microscilla marina ATCC 23134]
MNVNTVNNVVIRGLLISLVFLLSECRFFEKEFILPSPTALEAAEVGSDSFTAKWNKVTGAVGYEIDVATDENFNDPLPNYTGKKITEGVSLKVTGLEASSTYYYRTRALISNQGSQNSNIIQVTTASIDTPITYGATEAASTSFRAHWKKIPEATSYLLDVASDENFNNTYGQYKDWEVEEDTTLLVKDLEVNKKYFYRIRVKQFNSISAASNVQTVFTSTLATPKILEPTNIQLTSFSANWKSMPEATSYRIDVSADPLFNSMLTNYNDRTVGNNTLVIADLNANTTYYYRVRAMNGEITSNHSDIMLATTSNLTAPVATEASNIQPNSFQANWQGVDNASLYLLDVSLDANFTQTITGYQSKQIIDTFATVDGLLPNTKLYYRVKVQGLNAASTYSNTITVTTSSLPAPTAVAANESKAYSFMAQWQSQDNVNTFLLDVALDQNFTQFHEGYQAKEVMGTSHKITGLDFRATYYYRLRAKQQTKISNYSNVIEVIPAVSNSCRVLKLEHAVGGNPATYSQSFEYDGQGRVSKIIQYLQGDLRSHTVHYHANGTINKVVYLSTGSFTHQEFRYVYENGRVKTITQYGVNSGAVKAYWVFAYNSLGQRTQWISYRNVNKTGPIWRHHDYIYDANGNVVEVTNENGTTIKRYNYDDQLSPFALFNPDLAYYIKTTRNDRNWFLFTRNNTREEILDSGDVQGTILTAVQIYLFYYTNIGVAHNQEGHNSTKYYLDNCGN